MAQDSEIEFAEKMNRMIFDYLNEQKMEKIAKKFSKECGTDMDKKFKRPNLKKEWLNFWSKKESDEKLVFFIFHRLICQVLGRCYATEGFIATIFIGMMKGYEVFYIPSLVKIC